MKIVHLELSQLNNLVSSLHRHHKPVVGHRFSIGLDDGGKLIGGCSVGRPVARGCDQINTIEVTRLVTDGSKNACSMLYSAAARAGKELGYKKIQTYILDSESGTSLKAAGWCFELRTQGGNWTSKSKPDRRQDQPQCSKQRWCKILNA